LHQRVRALGVTHIDLAAGLRKFLGCEEDDRYKWVEREFDRAELLPSLKLASEKQQFSVFYNQTRGFQESIFANEEKPDSEESNQNLDVEYVCIFSLSI
jgi:hypothetical protein